MSNAIKNQYETLPYPERRAEDEDKRLVEGSPSDWREINHYVFGGKRDFAGPLRILDAGGGTGDATVMMAQQLSSVGCPAEIIYTDLSDASRAMTEDRLRRRGLDHMVTFKIGDFMQMTDLEPFDYINCCGVLHHLPDPDAGLKKLTSLLKDGGGMGIMVYAPLGRTGVYMMQQMMEILAPDQPVQDRLRLGKKLFQNLPAVHWIKQNRFVSDNLNGGDAGFYDLLLHSQDRPYTVPEVDALVTQAGLRRTSFVEPTLYEPENYVNDPVLKAKFSKMSEPERAATAELLSGMMKRHIFYVVKKDNPVALPSIMDDTVIPVLKTALPLDGDKAPANLTTTIDGITFRVPLRPGSVPILRQIDGETSLGEIRAALPGKPSAESFHKDMEPIHRALNGGNLLFYRYS